MTAGEIESRITDPLSYLIATITLSHLIAISVSWGNRTSDHWYLVPFHRWRNRTSDHTYLVPFQRWGGGGGSNLGSLVSCAISSLGRGGGDRTFSSFHFMPFHLWGKSSLGSLVSCAISLLGGIKPRITGILCHFIVGGNQT